MVFSPLAFVSPSKQKVINPISKSTNNSPANDYRNSSNKNQIKLTDSLKTPLEIRRDPSPGRQHTSPLTKRILRGSANTNDIPVCVNDNYSPVKQHQQQSFRLVQKETDSIRKENAELKQIVNQLTLKIVSKDEDIGVQLEEIKRLRQRIRDLIHQKDEVEGLLKLQNDRNDMNERKIEEMREEVIQLRDQHILFFK